MIKRSLHFRYALKKCKSAKKADQGIGTSKKNLYSYHSFKLKKGSKSILVGYPPKIFSLFTGKFPPSFFFFFFFSEGEGVRINFYGPRIISPQRGGRGPTPPNTTIPGFTPFRALETNPPPIRVGGGHRAALVVSFPSLHSTN